VIENDLELVNLQEAVHPSEQPASLCMQLPDGLLVMSLPLTAAQLTTLTARDVAVVLVDMRAAGIPAVVTDDVEGGRMATRHLIALGHERIGFIGDVPDNPFGFTSSASRERGYLETLSDAGLPAPAALRQYGPHVREVAATLAAELFALPDPPTAIFACSDVQAIGAIEASRAAGRDVPGDVSILGFDDIELAAYAGLTTVRQPLFESGARGARLLLERLAGGTSAASVTTLPLELVERATTAPVTLDPSGRRGRRRPSGSPRVTQAASRTPRDEGHGRDRP
jgi:DNA-binding LacI/PurR family transcriptional regulator